MCHGEVMWFLKGILNEGFVGATLHQQRPAACHLNEDSAWRHRHDRAPPPATNVQDLQDPGVAQRLDDLPRIDRLVADGGPDKDR